MLSSLQWIIMCRRKTGNPKTISKTEKSLGVIMDKFVSSQHGTELKVMQELEEHRQEVEIVYAGNGRQWYRWTPKIPCATSLLPNSAGESTTSTRVLELSQFTHQFLSTIYSDLCTCLRDNLGFHSHFIATCIIDKYGSTSYM